MGLLRLINSKFQTEKEKVMATFKENINRIFEGSEKEQYQAIVNEIRLNKAANLRLEAVVDKTVFAAANMIKHSVSLNRLNTLALALATCKVNPMLAKLPRVADYLGLQNVITWHKTEKVFQVINYASFKVLAQNLTLPRVKFHDWLKSNKKSSESILSEKQAASRLRNLFSDMRKSPEIANNPNYQSILQAMAQHLQDFDKDYCAIMEKEKIRNLINQ